MEIIAVLRESFKRPNSMREFLFPGLFRDAKGKTPMTCFRSDFAGQITPLHATKNITFTPNNLAFERLHGILQLPLKLSLAIEAGKAYSDKPTPPPPLGTL